MYPAQRRCCSSALCRRKRRKTTTTILKIILTSWSTSTVTSRKRTQILHSHMSRAPHREVLPPSSTPLPSQRWLSTGQMKRQQRLSQAPPSVPPQALPPQHTRQPQLVPSFTKRRKFCPSHHHLHLQYDATLRDKSYSTSDEKEAEASADHLSTSLVYRAFSVTECSQGGQQKQDRGQTAPNW